MRLGFIHSQSEHFDKLRTGLVEDRGEVLKQRGENTTQGEGVSVKLHLLTFTSIHQFKA